MPLRAYPHHALGPVGPLTQLRDLGMIRPRPIGQRQITGIEDADLAAIPTQQAGRLLREQP